MALPEITELQRIQLQPGDVLVLKFAGRAQPSLMKDVIDRLANAFPGNRVVGLDEHSDLLVIRAADVPENADEGAESWRRAAEKGL